jgi:glucokinase
MTMLLVGDIGGTKTDLAIVSAESGPREPLARKRFSSREYPSLEAIARVFVAEAALPVTRACFAVAGSVIGGKAALTNLPWVVEESVLRMALGVKYVRLLNDVEAIAAAVPHLQPSDLSTLQSGEAVPGGAIAVIASGTGIGEAFLIWDGARYCAQPSEGGHVNFGPTTPRETELLRYLQARWGRVSYERVCAGRSIPDLYDFLNEEGRIPESTAVRRRLDAAPDRTPLIVAAALDVDNPDPLCVAALDLFVANLGAEAGNLALTVLATGGVYVAGGMAQRVLPAIGSRRFLSKFHDKGRLSPMLERMPVHLILESMALVGAAAAASEEITPTTTQSARSVTT